MNKRIYKKEYNVSRERSKNLGVAVSEEEKKRFKKACEKLGLNQTEFILYVVEEVLRDEWRACIWYKK